MTADEGRGAGKGEGAGAGAREERNVVLKPVSDPELGEILIDDNLFAIGRNEPPFASYEPERVAELSRRHARIFWEGGGLYVADLGSKNGTLVNGTPVSEKPHPLQDGDQVCFGGSLAYRVRLAPRPAKARRAGALQSLTLTPARDDLGLQPIVIARFPFLISKIDEAFARYKEAYPHQVNYVSRRHAHIFLKGDAPFVEDLGSTNGTFVGGRRLDEHAVELHDGDLLAVGGNHFVYTVSLQREAGAEATLTKMSPLAAGAEDDRNEADKTTFVAAADSFLDIFCVDSSLQQDEVNAESAPPAAEGSAAAKPGRRSRRAIFLGELGRAVAGGPGTARRVLQWGVPLAALVAALAIGLHLAGADERGLKALLDAGDYARAATVADELLARDPDDAALKALGTEALLKAQLPAWLASLQAGDFERAAAVLAEMKAQGARNAEAQPLLAELEWIGEVEQFVRDRGGADAPIRLYADEDRIRALLRRWRDGAKEQQRALAQVAAHVPQVKEVQAEALTHLRRLESDESVYLAAIERLDGSIASGLNGDVPETLETVLGEYAEKYPRLAGIDDLRADLARYLELDRAMRERRLGPLVAVLDRVRFATPPFQRQLSTLGATRLPSLEQVDQYREVSRAWREGRTEQALAGLQQFPAGPWAEVAADELERRKAVLQQFGELQKARGGKDYEERLFAFHAGLEADEDVYFVRATEKEVASFRDKGLARAQDRLGRAQAMWSKYRSGGGIGGERRLEAGISAAFRTQAALLSQAQAEVRQGMRIYKLLNAEVAAQWTTLRDEVEAEAELQRRSLENLQSVLEPGLLKAKLALIGGRNDEE